MIWVIGVRDPSVEVAQYMSSILLAVFVTVSRPAITPDAQMHPGPAEAVYSLAKLDKLPSISVYCV